jgi:hypothetical protein
MRGIGIPTTGRIPTTMPRLMNNVEANTKLNPPIVNLQNLSLALKARYKHLNKIKKKIDKSMHIPINPNSSAITAKIKSVSASGKKFKLA